MKCSKCGTENTAGYKFCVKCGNKLEEEQPRKLFCTKCGTQLKEGMKFCTKCGTPVTAVSQPGMQPKSAAAPQPKPGVTSQPAAQPKPGAAKQPAPQPQPKPGAAKQPAPQPTPVVPTQPVLEKKKGKGLKVTLIVLVIVLLLALVGAGVYAWQAGYLDDILPGKDKVESTVTDDEEKDEEESDGVDSDAEEVPEIVEGDELSAAGDYLAAIDKYMEVDEDSDAYESALEKAGVALTQYTTEAKNHAQELADNENLDNYKQALSDLDDAVANTGVVLADYPDIQDFSDFDTEDLPYKTAEIESAFCQYAYSKVESYLVDANPTDATKLLDEAKEVMDGRPDTDYNAPVKEEFAKQYAAKYGKSAVQLANQLSLSATDAQVAARMRELFSVTDNNCWVVELYEHYATQAGELEAFGSVDFSGDYLLPESADRELTVEDIENLSRAELRMARYEIYARHGRDFSDPAVNSYFQSKSWYNYSVSFAEFYEYDLSDVELYNRDFILNYELEAGYLD